ncbi:MAG TPA: hypothetical protein VFX16_05955 [Pseudonocardiaceae bacterium]|nr:hypothetical protein [Pseudonocardiaceae bacterium]
MNTDCTSVARLAEPQVRAVLAAAGNAPAPPGQPPWLFGCTALAIELYENEDATHLAHDDRVVACGGALLNLRLAVQTMGIYADVRLAPDPVQPRLLAAVRPANERLATTWDRQLARVSTGTTDAVPVPTSPTSALRELRRAADVERAWLAQVSGAQLTELYTPDADAVEPMFVVIGSLQNDVRALLRAGQAIRRVMLTATVLGLRTTMLSGPVATPGARAELQTLIGGALSPHAVLAVTVADSTPATVDTRTCGADAGADTQAGGADSPAG